MVRLASVFTLILTALAVHACGDHDAHDHARREFPQTYLVPPSRPLVWGDLNIIHTTDTHGWLLGHQKGGFPEPNYRYAPIPVSSACRNELRQHPVETWATSRPL